MLIPNSTIVAGNISRGGSSYQDDYQSIRPIPEKKQLNPGLVSHPGVYGRAVVNRLRGLGMRYPYLKSTRG